ncbi:MAG: DUF6766 family protein [Thiohalocapsa sp.]
MKAVVEWIKENALSISMFILFVGFLFADSATGLKSYNHQQASQGFAPVDYWGFLGTGAFMDGIFLNWQAALLQLTVLIIFSEFMSQKGASHSRKPEEEEGGQQNGGGKRSSGEAQSRPCQHGGSQRQKGGKDRSKEKQTEKKSGQGRTWWQDTWLYRNSLSLAFIVMFAISFGLHVVYGAKAYNEQRALLHQEPIGIGSYAISSKLWSDTFECWQAEFFVMWFFLIASIYLRQEYSSESKSLGAGIRDTGDPNE